MSGESGFTEEQKQYLEGFLGGILSRRGAPPSAPPDAAPPDIGRSAQDRVLAAGGQLVPEEQAKRRGHPLDMWDEIRANVAAGRFPKGIDVFRHKFFGLFYVAPAQDAFMCRLRIPNGILTSWQMQGIADLAERHAGLYADVTTRANLQLREIGASGAIAVLTGLQDLGLTSRGAGADNIRNITGSATAGIDKRELIDTRPLCRELHHMILNHRELYGLPRKFNIGFDGGGQVSVLEDTNDIGFTAVSVGPGSAVPPGVYFRMALGGITGHGDFARDTGVLLQPEECVPAAIAVVRVFIATGNRTDRTRARLKYVLDAWGIENFLAEVEREFGTPFRRLPLDACQKRPPALKHGHIGVHEQRQAGLSYIGVALPVGRISADRLRGLAAIAERFGSGTLRLTVWQNLLISDVPNERVTAACEAIEALGLDWRASAVRGALVACTGSTGCRFSATDTKAHAALLADHLEAHVTLDQPIAIQLTGCPHSCAQHLVGDIGLLGTKRAEGEDMIDAYSIAVGGGAGHEQGIGREIFSQVPLADMPATVARMISLYLAHRGPAESYNAFVSRHTIEALQALFAPVSEMAV